MSATAAGGQQNYTSRLTDNLDEYHQLEYYLSLYVHNIDLYFIRF